MQRILALSLWSTASGAVWSSTALCAAVLVVVWSARHDADLTDLSRPLAARAGTAPAWLSSGLWWHALVGVALAVLLGDGVPLWIALVAGIAVGALDRALDGRMVLIVALPSLWFLGRAITDGTYCATGTGPLGWSVPIGALIAGWSVADPARRADAPRRWWPETVALLAVGATVLVLVPVRLAFGLVAEHTPMPVWAVGTTLAVAALIAAGRRGAAVAGIAVSLVVLAAAQLCGPSLCDGPTWSLLVTMAATTTGAALVGVTRLGLPGHTYFGEHPLPRTQVPRRAG